MSLLDLPEEVFMMIVKCLDLKALNSLYDTCQYARNVLQIRNLVKEWNMTRSSMATVKYLKCDFFKSIAGHLVELNLCGVTDLCKTALLPALKRLKNLKTLDVSYTDIDLVDFCDIYKACPSIKNLCINFEFDKNVFRTNIVKYQEIFKNMNNLHFVGSCTNLIYSNIVLRLLAKSALNMLQLTVLHCRATCPIVNDDEYLGLVKFNELYVYLMNLEANYGYYYSLSIFQGISTDNCEMIIIENRAFLDEIEVYASPIFKKFFSDEFDINIIDIDQYDYYLIRNVAVMIFNKDSIKFDGVFFKRLYNRVKDYFPYVFDTDHQSPGPDKFDWYYTHPIVAVEPKSSSNYMEFKRKRIGNPSYTLDYDTVFKNKYKAKLSLSFGVNYVNPIALSPNSNFLSKLRFLSLAGTVRYTVEFFNVLFRCCNNLETLDVVAPSISPCFAPICRSIPLSQSLKNFRLIDRNFDFNTFFNSFSQCKTLQNIHILDQSSEPTTLADPSALFENCEHLYNICIKANMTDTVRRKMLRLFNDVKKVRGRPQIHVTLCQILFIDDTVGLNYEPSIEVFNIFPIKPKRYFI